MLWSDADSASIVPRASGTCSDISTLFVANRAPMTAESSRLSSAATRSGTGRFVSRNRMIAEITIAPATMRRWPRRTPSRAPTWLPTITPTPWVSATVAATPSLRANARWK